MMRQRLPALFLLIGALAPSLTGAQDTTALPDGYRESMLGCWRMYRQPHEPAALSMYWVSQVARLDSVASTSPFRTRYLVARRQLIRLNLAGLELNPLHRPTSDWYVEADSVHLVFNSGFSGTEMILALDNVRRDTLTGRAHGWGDVNNYRVNYDQASAVRVTCPEPPDNPNGWTAAQLELHVQRSADSTCSSWPPAREQTARDRGTFRVDSASGRQCFQPPRRSPMWVDGRWFCPGAPGIDSALRANSTVNRVEMRRDRRGVEEAQCPGWHEAVELRKVAPPS